MPRYKSVHTGAQIDSGVERALPGGIIDQMRPTRNLLDNWDFRNPVNQRGQTSYTGMGYGIDRWTMQTGSPDSVVTVNSNGTITVRKGTSFCNLISPIDLDEYPDLRGKVITFSWLVENNVGCKLRLVANNSVIGGGGALDIEAESSENQLTVIIPTENTRYLQPTIACGAEDGNQVTIKALKLEIGDKSTLAHQDENGVWVLNEIPDYGEQLRRCQRYFYKTGKVFLTGGADSATKMSFSLDSCNHMRKKPSVSTFTPVYVKGGGAYKASPTVSSVATEGNPDGFYLAVTFGDTGISAYNNVYCYATSLELTADL